MARALTPITDEKGELNLSISQIKNRYGIKSDLQIRFALTYLGDPRRNGARTYAKTYKGKTKPTKGDSVAACNLLKLDSPVGRLINDIDTGAAQVMVRKNLITKEQVLSELIKVGFSDIGDLYDEDNNVLSVANLQSDVSPAIRKIKEKILKKSLDDATGEESTVLLREIEMHDKKGALQLIGQHLQMFIQKGEIEVTTSIDDIIRDITEQNAANRNGLLPKDNIRLEDRKVFDNE